MRPDKTATETQLLIAFARAHPEQWVKANFDLGSPKLTLIKRGDRYGVEPGTFEVTSRTRIRGGSERDAYVKYTGRVLDPPPLSEEEIAATNRACILANPPSDGRGTSGVKDWLDQCRFHHGVWVRRARAHTAAAYAIRKGTNYGAKPGEFDATNRAGPYKDPTLCDLYVQYMGDPPEGERDPNFELYFTPPPRTSHSTVHSTSDAGKLSPLGQWLDQVVRKSPDRSWCDWGGDFNLRVKNRVEAGEMYGARPGEFEVEKELFETASRFMVRVREDWDPDQAEAIAEDYRETRRRAKLEEAKAQSAGTDLVYWDEGKKIDQLLPEFKRWIFAAKKASPEPVAFEHGAIRPHFAEQIEDESQVFGVSIASNSISIWTDVPARQSYMVYVDPDDPKI